MSFISVNTDSFDAAAERWQSVEERADEAWALAERAAADVVTNTVHQRGQRAGWNTDLLDSIDLMEDGRIGLPPDSPFAEEARRREYGDRGQRPQPVLRTSVNRSKKKAAEVFTEVLTQELFSE